MADLAERDALTKIVLETLEEAGIDPGHFPPEVKEMLDVLPLEIRSEVESEWDECRNPATLEEVRAIILDALGTKGGQAS